MERNHHKGAERTHKKHKAFKEFIHCKVDNKSHRSFSSGTRKLNETRFL